MTAIITKRFDNWKQIDYRTRVLDCVASTLQVYSDCAAVAIDRSNHRFVVSYNRTLPEHKINPYGVVTKYNVYRARVDTFNYILSIANGMHQSELHKMLLNFTLFLTDFAEYLEIQAQFEAEELSSLLKKMANVAEESTARISNDVQFLSNFLQDTPIPQEYRDILEHIRPKLNTADLESDEDIRQRGAVLTRLIRPASDSYRVSTWLLENSNEVRNPVHVLTNISQMHAEVNIAMTGINYQYIGVSKLACKECHDILNFKSAPHRGTHGLVFPGYRILINSYEQFVEISRMGAKPSNALDGNVVHVNQHRRLSDSLTEEMFESFRNITKN